MPKTIVHSDRAPKAIGPYSQATKAGNLVFCSGQIPLDPATGEMVKGDVVVEARRVLDNLVAVLEAAGAGTADVVRTTIFLVDLGDFSKVNEVYSTYFAEPYPARVTIQVAALPRGARVEIDAVAVLPLRRNEPPMSFTQAILDAQADRAVATIRGVGADEQADLIDAWQKAKNVAAIAAVARDDDAPAPARKAARRAVNVLKARGVAIPDANATAKPLAKANEWTTEARLLAPDQNGNSVITVLSRATGRDARLCDVVLSPVGVLRVTSGAVSSSKLREWEKSVQSERGFGPVTVDLAWARHRVKAAAEKNAKTGVLLPLEYEQAADMLGGAPDAEPAHPLVAAGLSLDHADAEAVKGSATLHNIAELAFYLPTRQAIDELLAKVGEHVSAAGTTEPTSEQFSKWVEEEAAAATDRFFTPEIREELAARLLDAAISVHGRVGADEAKRVLAVRTAMLKAGLVTDPPRDIPFLQAFFQKAVALLLQAGGGRLTVPVPQKPALAGYGLQAAAA